MKYWNCTFFIFCDRIVFDQLTTFGVKIEIVQAFLRIRFSLLFVHSLIKKHANLISLRVF